MNVLIHLIRHAEATQRIPGNPDEYRHLTCRGRSRFRRVAAGLKKIGIDPYTIITSPSTRAVQTAEIIAECIRFSGEVVVAQALAGELPAAGLRELLKSYPATREIVLVGHEPYLGHLVGELLSLPGPCVFKKGSVVTLQIHVGQASQGAVFVRLITGGAKVVEKSDKGLERLMGKHQTTEEVRSI